MSQLVFENSNPIGDSVRVFHGQKPAKTPVGNIFVKWSMIFVTFLLIQSLTGCKTKDVVLRLQGSNTIGSALAPALVEGYLRKIGAQDIQRKSEVEEETIIQAVLPGSKDVKTIEIKAHGSGTAPPAMEKSDCDIGMMSRRITADEVQQLAKLGNLRAPSNENIIAMDGVAIIVNKSNPVRELKIQQIAQIFTGEINNWSAVGGNSGAINVYARDDKSGTFDTFKNLVLGKDKKPMDKAKRFEDSQALSNEVSRDPNGIGFIGLPYVGNTNALAVYDEGTRPLLPSPVTINRREYLLYRELYFYLPQTSSNDMAKGLVTFALSDEGQDIAEKVGFISQAPSSLARQSSPPSSSPAVGSLPPELAQIKSSYKAYPAVFYFETGVSDLDNKSLGDLSRTVKYLQDQGVKEIILAGFADRRGTDQQCIELSMQRAETVKKEFERAGLNPVVKPFGKAAPIDTKDTPDAWQKNRRVEIYHR